MEETAEIHQVKFHDWLLMDVRNNLRISNQWWSFYIRRKCNIFVQFSQLAGFLNLLLKLFEMNLIPVLTTQFPRFILIGRQRRPISNVTYAFNIISTLVYICLSCVFRYICALGAWIRLAPLVPNQNSSLVWHNYWLAGVNTHKSLLVPILTPFGRRTYSPILGITIMPFLSCIQGKTNYLNLGQFLRHLIYPKKLHFSSKVLEKLISLFCMWKEK